jgi:hypothetical protein
MRLPALLPVCLVFSLACSAAGQDNVVVDPLSKRHAVRFFLQAVEIEPVIEKPLFTTLPSTMLANRRTRLAVYLAAIKHMELDAELAKIYELQIDAIDDELEVMYASSNAIAELTRSAEQSQLLLWGQKLGTDFLDQLSLPTGPTAEIPPPPLTAALGQSNATKLLAMQPPRKAFAGLGGLSGSARPTVTIPKGMFSSGSPRLGGSLRSWGGTVASGARGALIDIGIEAIAYFGAEALDRYMARLDEIDPALRQQLLEDLRKRRDETKKAQRHLVEELAQKYGDFVSSEFFVSHDDWRRLCDLRAEYDFEQTVGITWHYSSTFPKDSVLRAQLGYDYMASAWTKPETLKDTYRKAAQQFAGAGDLLPPHPFFNHVRTQWYASAVRAWHASSPDRDEIPNKEWPIAWAEKAIAAGSSEAQKKESRLLLAFALADAGRPQEGLAHFEAEYLINGVLPKDIGLVYHYARLLSLAGRTADSLATLQSLTTMPLGGHMLARWREEPDLDRVYYMEDRAKELTQCKVTPEVVYGILRNELWLERNDKVPMRDAFILAQWTSTDGTLTREAYYSSSILPSCKRSRLGGHYWESGLVGATRGRVADLRFFFASRLDDLFGVGAVPLENVPGTYVGPATAFGQGGTILKNSTATASVVTEDGKPVFRIDDEHLKGSYIVRRLGRTDYALVAKGGETCSVPVQPARIVYETDPSDPNHIAQTILLRVPMTAQTYKVLWLQQPSK